MTEIRGAMALNLSGRRGSYNIIILPMFFEKSHHKRAGSFDLIAVLPRPVKGVAGNPPGNTPAPPGERHKGVMVHKDSAGVCPVGKFRLFSVKREKKTVARGVVFYFRCFHGV
jgi:hypothetical protein